MALNFGKEKCKMTRYYSTQRPVLPGGYPRKAAVEEIHNFDTKTVCEEIGWEAWGYIDYMEPLTNEEAESYELVLGGMKPYWCEIGRASCRERV